MILFKAQFKQKILDWIKTTTYRQKRWIYYTKWSIINTNFTDNGNIVKLLVESVTPIDQPDYMDYIKDWFNSIEEMKSYFLPHIWTPLIKVEFIQAH